MSREENTSRAENDEASRRESNAASQQESNVASLQKSPEPGRNRESPRGWNNLMALLAGIAIGPVIWLFSKGGRSSDSADPGEACVRSAAGDSSFDRGGRDVVNRCSIAVAF